LGDLDLFRLELERVLFVLQQFLHWQHLNLEQMFPFFSLGVLVLIEFGDLDLFKLELGWVFFDLQQFLHFKLEHIPGFLVELVFLILLDVFFLFKQLQHVFLLVLFVFCCFLSLKTFSLNDLNLCPILGFLFGSLIFVVAGVFITVLDLIFDAFLLSIYCGLFETVLVFVIISSDEETGDFDG
jgi:hypothetical protein